MMRSLYSAVSGLQNHQTRMDVLGNNIANVNTTGFKKSRTIFEDMLYQQLGGASAPTGEIGGVNPKEVGLGMKVGSIDTVHTQGTLQSTGIVTDIAVQGNGFLVEKNGERTLYTRDGALGLDKDGRLVNPSTGYRVQGWMARDVDGRQLIATSGATTDLIIPVGSKDPARATSIVELACNLDKRTAEIAPGANQALISQNTWRVEEKIYDSFGSPHIFRVDFTKIPGQANQWNGVITIDPESTTNLNPAVDLGQNPAQGNANNFIVEFDNRGLLLQIRDAQGNASPTTGPLDLGFSFDVPSTTAQANGAQTRQNIRLNLGTVGSATNTITQEAERSSTKVFSQDGYTLGYLDSFKIDQTGVISGVYSNGSSRNIGQIALGSFTNPSGLEKAGETNFMQSNNSGLANVGVSGVAGKGKIISGTLEMSNVDLAEQMVDMIVTERGFQANSRTIQTTDQMLQEIMTLKR